jgi:serine/threonine protein kinase
MSLDLSRGPKQFGNYDLLSKIAEGGMGAVYKGRSRETGQIVAIKIVPPEAAKSPLLLKRFEQEFKAASLIDHPNVVKALDYCGTGTSPFLVMEFVDGESLGQKVERDGALKEAEAIRLIGQVCEGLHRAHKQGLIHRDVKPDNILVTRDGVTAKLTDLGLVKDIEGELNLTKTGRGLGTPHFMAPEQFRNAKNADVRCDVYSLGATLYTMLTGLIPFDKTSPLDCWVKKSKNDFAEPRLVNPKVSERVSWAVRRSMSADPTQRPASCREFMEDLTGGGWKSGQNATDSVALFGEDLWYMVYRDETGAMRTVKGNTDSIRKNIQTGALGDVSTILVSRTKTGQFQPVKTIPEFRDLLIGPAPSGIGLAAMAGSKGSNSRMTPPADPNAVQLGELTGGSGPTSGRLGQRSGPRISPSMPLSATRQPPQPASGTRSPPPVAMVETSNRLPMVSGSSGKQPKLPDTDAPFRHRKQKPDVMLYVLVGLLVIAAGIGVALFLK